jgi:hypothetical protein
MSFRRAICWGVIAALLAFALLVYAPPLGRKPAHAALSVRSDCTDERKAMVTVQLDKTGNALVNVGLQNNDGAFSPGTCNHIEIEFPGHADDVEIFFEETKEIPGVPKRFRVKVNAGSRLVKSPGIGDGERLALNLEGSPPIAPTLSFRWLDAIDLTGFTTSQIAVPFAPIAVHGSPLIPVKSTLFHFVIPNEFENASLSPSPAEILPLGSATDNQYQFPTSVGVVTLKWTSSVRSVIKEVGIIVLSLLAGAAISDLITYSPPERKDKDVKPLPKPVTVPTKKQKRRR